MKSLFRRNRNFIEIYDNALSKKECEILINQFEKSDKVIQGLTSRGYTPEYKKCLEIKGDFTEKNIINNILRPKVISYMQKFVDKNKFPCEFDNMGALDFIQSWTFSKYYNIQKYENEDDGYKQWHCEHGTEENSNRILAWMFYLNDAKCGTEFAYFPTVNAKAGRCVIWPAFWTHLHRGVIPNKGIKYIATGWYEYCKDD